MMAMTSRPSDTYTHGHHPAVVGMHALRTAENSAGFLLPHLREGDRLLDVGCGPGTITVDLARRLGSGSVLGIDSVPGVIDQAARHVTNSGVTNVEVRLGDVYALDLPDACVDVVYAHQVLQHLTEPVAALVEMRRVVKPGGLIAVRDSDYATMVHAPPFAALGRWLELHHEVTRRNGVEADAGRYLLGWCRAAGLEPVQVTSETTTYGDAEGRAIWGEGWAVRVTDSAFSTQAIGYGVTTREELADIAAAFRSWAAHDDGFWAFLHGEVIARRPMS